jgi:hypothetical protein
VIRAANLDFMALQRDPGPDIPILTQTKAEYAKLHYPAVIVEGL